MFAMVGLAVLNVYSIAVEYCQYHFTTETIMSFMDIVKNPDDHGLPDVTICNLNPMQKNRHLMEYITKVRSLNGSSYDQREDLMSMSSFYQNIRSSTIRSEIGQQRNNFIIDCQVNIN